MQLQFSPAVGGQHRWFGMIMPAGVYTMNSNMPWVDPVDPGPNIIYPTLVGKNECCQAEYQHLEAQINFHQMMFIETTLKNLLYAAIKPKYWVSIRDTILGLMHSCILMIFHWLFHKYGWIYP